LTGSYRIDKSYRYAWKVRLAGGRGGALWDELYARHVSEANGGLNSRLVRFFDDIADFQVFNRYNPRSLWRVRLETGSCRINRCDPRSVDRGTGVRRLPSAVRANVLQKHNCMYDAASRTWLHQPSAQQRGCGNLRRRENEPATRLKQMYLGLYVGHTIIS
jgi:hypothetical protein